MDQPTAPPPAPPRAPADDQAPAAQLARQAIASAGVGLMMIWWGLAWAGCSAARFYLPHKADWFLLAGAGAALTGAVLTVQAHRPLRRTPPAAAALAGRLFWFWMLLFLGVGLLLGLWSPARGIAVAAALASAVLLGLAVTGLWLDSAYLVQLGLAATAVVALAYTSLPARPPLLHLWAGAALGFGLILAGLHVHRHWR